MLASLSLKKYWNTLIRNLSVSLLTGCGLAGGGIPLGAPGPGGLAGSGGGAGSSGWKTSSESEKYFETVNCKSTALGISIIFIKQILSSLTDTALLESVRWGA